MHCFCSICGSTDFEQLADFGLSPIAGDYLSSSTPRHQYPLNVVICKSCCHAELSYKLSPDLLYGPGFSYVSRSSPGLLEYFSFIVNYTKKYLTSSSDSAWLDIGSNDSSLLDLAYKSGFITYGIEPSSAYIERAASPHEIINSYADSLAFKAFRGRKFDVISVLNTLSNTLDPLDLFKKLSENLSSNGILVVSTGLLDDICSGNIDYIYHEHNHYFSVSSLSALANASNLQLVDVQFNPQKGGSVLSVFSTIGRYPLHDPGSLIASDSRGYIDSYNASLSRFRSTIQLSVLPLLTRADSFDHVCVFGASQSVTSLLLKAHIPDQFSFYVDDKIGRAHV